MPPLTAVVPVKVFAPKSTQVPLPALVNEVALVLSTMALPSVFAAVLVPSSVRGFAPAPVAVRGEVRIRAPDPDASRVAPPVVPARLITRSLVWPLPVYWSVPAVPLLPMLIVPLATEMGVPKALAPPLTLVMELMDSMPALIVVVPL